MQHLGVAILLSMCGLLTLTFKGVYFIEYYLWREPWWL